MTADLLPLARKARSPLRGTALAILLVAGLTGGAAAQQAAQPAAAPDAGATSKTTRLGSSGWTLQCKPDARQKSLLCEASQTIVVAESRDTLLAAYVTPKLRDGAVEGFYLRFQLPHGLDLSAGVNFRIDEGPEQSPDIQTSSQAGLFARVELTDDLLAALKKGAAMTINVSALNGNTLSIPLTLNGFSAVYAKLR